MIFMGKSLWFLVFQIFPNKTHPFFGQLIALPVDASGVPVVTLLAVSG